MLIVPYDEWGGFFDHVPPPFKRGSAGAPRVASTVFDATSILKLIEWRWNLAPLTARDASSDVGNLAAILDLDHPDASLPPLPFPAPPPVTPCPPESPSFGDLPLSAIALLGPVGTFPAR